MSNTQLSAGGRAALCSAVLLLGLVTVAKPWEAPASTMLVSASTTRATNVQSHAGMSAPVNTRMQARPSAHSTVYHHESKVAMPPQQMEQIPQYVQAPQGSTMGAPFLALTAMIGTTLGAVAMFFSKKQSQYQTLDDIEGPKANWAVGVAAAAAVAVPQVLAPADMMPMAYAGLPSSDPISNAEALLRNALPIPKSPGQKEIRQIQADLESITRQLRIPGSKPLGPIAKSVDSAYKIITNDKKKAQIIAAFAPEKKDQGIAAINELTENLAYFKRTLDNGDKQGVPIVQLETLSIVGKVEEAMISGFPFEVPAKYSTLPQLKGRATVEVVIKFNDNIDVQEGTMTMVLDGYNAPVTAGNFFDLVQKGFYDGLDISRSDGFVIQTGDPEGPADSYEINGVKRVVPFEVKVVGDKEPYYEETLEDLGVYNAPVELPFNAFGTMALAKKEFSANSGSSQIFWLLKDSELTPVGNNVLDGRYSCFGYITKNQDLLKEMKVGDKIVSMKITSGAENFIPGDDSAPPLVFDN